jgi:hypothetical protein
MEGPVVVAPHQPCAMPMVSLEVPFAPGATIVLSSRRRDDEQDASAITPDVPMPPWVSKLLSEEEKFDVQSGVLLFWKGHLNDNFRERKRRKVSRIFFFLLFFFISFVLFAFVFVFVSLILNLFLFSLCLYHLC